MVTCDFGGKDSEHAGDQGGKVSPTSVENLKRAVQEKQSCLTVKEELSINEMKTQAIRTDQMKKEGYEEQSELRLCESSYTRKEEKQSLMDLVTKPTSSCTTLKEENLKSAAL